ncbi:UDP-glucose 4-epimerase GalE [Brevundimonas lenta]|uniref:UDP-glucose 4-epimerase n=1 Tax=Brevundimonas lenta TaxID=424796 RepID=A0A7W6JGX3_9CAUL|nr:UDP-glucose 4-epimerase GalE [Brevundimonas lenta]MBB4083968.1 UDP-glucose 4-epimerase/UDP-arabinose 4-epimerase [Brevundimonas lenta]
MTRKAILVTGGAGYIGSHACKALSLAGYLPVTLDDLSTGNEAFVRWGPLVLGDIHDVERVRATLVEHDVAAVMHFAASSIVGESATNPLLYFHNNLGGTLALLEGMRQAGCDNLVFSSTCAVYGDAPGGRPMSEDTPRNPVNTYGRAKLMCEEVIAEVASKQSLNPVMLRYFNACGADPDGEIGEFRQTETHLIPRAMMAIQGHIDDFQVFGEDFDTPDGTAIRDYIHVSDLARAHVQALERLIGGAKGRQAFNLGTGDGYSVREVLQTISEVSGHSLPAPAGARRPGDPPRLVADPHHARQELGFAPAHSDLQTIVSTAWSWHRHAHPRGAPASCLSAVPANDVLSKPTASPAAGPVLGVRS